MRPLIPTARTGLLQALPDLLAEPVVDTAEVERMLTREHGRARRLGNGLHTDCAVHLCLLV